MSYRGARVQVCDKNDNVLVDDIVLTCKNNKTAQGSIILRYQDRLKSGRFFGFWTACFESLG